MRMYLRRLTLLAGLMLAVSASAQNARQDRLPLLCGAHDQMGAANLLAP